MEKLFRSADRILSEIGRITLGRPLLASILLISVITITVCANELWHTSSPSVVAVAEEPNATSPVATAQQAAPTPLLATSPVSVQSTTPVLTAVKSTAPLAISPIPPASIAKPQSKTTRAAQKKDVGPKAQPAGAITSAGMTYVSGRIIRSLAVDAKKAGLSVKQVNQLVQIFNQKKLVQSMKSGDEFSVLYENKASVSPKKSAKSGSSNILAAQLIIGDKTYQLIRFVDPKGRVDYYTPQGQSLRDGLSRSPLNYTHISSYFSNNRFDPILRYRRPHEGVDFAAPYGTPVQAAGDGTIAEAAYRGGYGRMVTIQHDSKYATRYAHLSGFASNVKAGQVVKKGQIIGYVGRTGFATGPHLHFEIRVNNVAANPLTVAVPGASIPANYRLQFLAKSKVLVAQLNTNRQVWLAQAKQSSSRQKG